MGRRGMSLKEKKNALVKILHTSLTPFTVKELEKLGSKAGVNSMTVKSVLEELRDDFIVDCDKIGSSVYYWSFPSKQLATSLKQNKDLEHKRSCLEEQVKALGVEHSKLVAAREESSERSSKLAEVDSLNQTFSKLKSDLTALKQTQRGKDLVRMLKLCKEACNRWTDNTWAFVSYLKKKHGSSMKDAQKALQMKDDFDYPAYVPKRKKSRHA